MPPRRAEPGPEPNAPEPRERLLLGEIGAAQGLKGEVRLRSYTQDPAAIARYDTLEDEHGGTIEIESLRVTPKALIARIKGVTTREAAEALNHTKLYIDRALLPERDEEEWYHVDLIGLAVVDQRRRADRHRRRRPEFRRRRPDRDQADRRRPDRARALHPRHRAGGRCRGRPPRAGAAGRPIRVTSSRVVIPAPVEIQ